MIREAPWLLEWVDGDRREPVEPPQTVHKWTPSRPVTARTALRCTALQPTLPCGYEASRWLPLAAAGVGVVRGWVGGFRLFSGCLVCGVSSNWKGGRAGHPASQSRKGQAEVAGTPYMCVMDVTLWPSRGTNGSGTTAHGTPQRPARVSLGFHLVLAVMYSILLFPLLLSLRCRWSCRPGLVWLSPKQNSLTPRLLVPANWWCRLPGPAMSQICSFELTRGIIAISSNPGRRSKKNSHVLPTYKTALYWRLFFLFHRFALCLCQSNAPYYPLAKRRRTTDYGRRVCNCATKL